MNNKIGGMRILSAAELIAMPEEIPESSQFAIWCKKAHAEYWAICANTQSHDRARIEARNYVLETITAVRKEFARINGWKVNHLGFSLDMLATNRERSRSARFLGDTQIDFPPSGTDFDHPDFFKCGRYPKAIIVHNYNGPPPRDQVPSSIHIIPLQWSWYSPGNTEAWCLVPRLST